MNKLKGKKIALISTVPYFMVSQLSSQIQYFASLGMQVTIITSSGEELSELPKADHIRVIIIDIPRKLNPLSDFVALLKLIHIFNAESFDILHSFTPKAGLLCSIAGWIGRIPLRFHTFTGQPWVTRKGLMRSVMRSSDRLIVQLMRHCYADSHSQCKFLITEGIGNANSISVIGNGSLGGVDIQRFSPSYLSDEKKDKCKADLGISDASCVFIYIGRITIDKGIHELLDAFKIVQKANPQAYLLLVGPVDDDGEALTYQAKEHKNVYCLGYQGNPEYFLAISDILCLPSYREGFGTVVIEAAAMGVPCIGTNISGLVDAVDDGVTGVLVRVKDSEELCNAMRHLMDDRKLRERMGEAARCRAVDCYDSIIINLEWAREYIRWMKG